MKRRKKKTSRWIRTIDLKSSMKCFLAFYPLHRHNIMSSKGKKPSDSRFQIYCQETHCYYRHVQIITTFLSYNVNSISRQTNFRCPRFFPYSQTVYKLAYGSIIDIVAVL